MGGTNMKKTISAIILVLLLGLSVFAFAACEKESTTYTGEYSYEAYGTLYGVKVDVTVSDDKITAVKLYTDEESGMVRTSPSWQHFEATESAYPYYLKKFVGLTVSGVKALDITQSLSGAPIEISDKNFVISGATQTSGRIVLAVQDALSKIK